MFSVGYTNDGWSPSLGTQEMTTLGFMASQELSYPGKRGLRGDIAQHLQNAIPAPSSALERVSCCVPDRF